MSTASEKKRPKRKRPIVAPCRCIDDMNKKLRAHNAVIEQKFIFDPPRLALGPPQILLMKIDAKKRGDLPSLVCSHCPCCGAKWKL